MLSHTAKIVISSGLSALGVILYLLHKGRKRKTAMTAMLLSTAGDLFMTDTFGLGGISLYPGALFFMAAHVLTAVSYRKFSMSMGYDYKNKGLKAGVAVVLLSTAALTAGMFIANGSLQSMYFPLLIYLAVIGYNLCSQFSLAYSEKGLRRFLYPGMSLFLFSDLVIFVNMLNITAPHDDLCWATYAPAQLLLLLFNSDRRGDAAVN